MLTLYFDASAFTKLFLSEDGSVGAGELWELDTPLVSSTITYAETSAAIAAAGRARRLSRAGMTTALRTLDSRWQVVAALDVNERVTRTAGGLAIRHRLRAMDSIHLASALTVAAARPLVVTWDVDLRRAARAEGLAVSV